MLSVGLFTFAACPSAVLSVGRFVLQHATLPCSPSADSFFFKTIAPVSMAKANGAACSSAKSTQYLALSGRSGKAKNRANYSLTAQASKLPEPAASTLPALGGGFTPK